MRKFLLGAAAAAVAAGSVAGLGAFAAPNDGPPGGPDSQRMEDHAALLDAGLAGLKAALKLTPDQEKNWAPFESAIRDAAKMRQDAMREMREAMHDRAMGSPIDRLDMMATRLDDASKRLHAIADAAKPLYASLDASQQHRFDFLARTLMDRGRDGFGGGPHMARWQPGPPPGEGPMPPDAQ